MEMNYFKKTGKMMVAACMLAGLPFIPGTVSASELQTQMMSVQMESTTLKELFDLIEEKFNYTFLIRNNDINLNERISIDMSNRSVEEILTTALKRRYLKRQPSFFVMQPVYYPFLYLKYLWSSQLLLFEKSSYRNK